MKEEESSGLFLKTSKKVALSAVVSALLVQGLSATSNDFNVTATTTPLDVPLLGTSDYASDGDSISNPADLTGTITAGDYTTNVDGSTNNISGSNTVGNITGLDINNSIANIENNFTVSTSVLTLASHGNPTQYPDQNNTQLSATGVKVSSAITGGIFNNGTVQTSATLHNDTNNSIAEAIGIKVENTIAHGIVNTGTISATATTSKVTHDSGTGARNGDTTVATIGGHTGTSGTLIASELNDEDASYSSAFKAKNPGTQSTTSEHDTDEIVNHMKKDHYVIDSTDDIHTATRTPKQDNPAPADLDNEITAEGILVGAAVTGGITNHNYISSVKTTSTVVGDAAGDINGMLITPNTGVAPTGSEGNVTGTDQNDSQIQAMIDADTDDVNNSVDANTTNVGFTNINTGSDGNGSLSYTHTLGANNGKLGEDNNFSNEVKASIEAQMKSDYEDQNQTVKPGGVVQTAIDNLPDNIRKAYKLAPSDANISGEVQAKIDARKAANAASGPASTPAADASDGFKSGTHIARIGNTVLNADVTGKSSGNGILVRATSDTSLDGNITSGGVGGHSGTLDANQTMQNAGVTSGTVEAYLGEGTESNGDSRRVNLDRDSDRVTNHLIGGLTNNATIKGDGASAGLALNSAAFAKTNQTNDINISEYQQSDIKSSPSSKVGVGHLLNTGTLTSANGAGLELLSKADGTLKTSKDINGHELSLSPSSVTNIRKFDNNGTIKGGMGGTALNGDSTANALVEAANVLNTEGNATQTTGITVSSHADSTIGDFFSSGDITQSLGADALKLTSSGTSELKSKDTNNSIVEVDSTSIGGIRKVFGKDGNSSVKTDGDFINAGNIKASLASHAINMTATGEASLKNLSSSTTINSSDVSILSKTITGVEGDFINTAYAEYTDDNLTKSATAKRGIIKASLASDAVHLIATGTSTLTPKSIDNSTVEVSSDTTSGVRDDFGNYGDIKVSLASNGVNLSSDATSKLGTAATDHTTITASTVTNKTTVTSGTGSDFINGASAIEIGALNSDSTIQVHNPYDHTSGSYIKQKPLGSGHFYYTVAANINENNTSDTNSTNAHAAGVNAYDPYLRSQDDGVFGDVNITGNDLVSTTVHYYNKEASITSATIKASLASDAVKFQSDSTGDLKVEDINTSTTARIHIGTDANTTYNTQTTKSNVTSISESDSSIGSNFINNGAIEVSLAANGVNGTSNATGTLGDSANNTNVTSSDVNQTTTSQAGVRGDFRNEAISREVGSATAFAALSSNGWQEVGAFTYNRATNIGDVKIKASLASDAVELESHADNKIDLKLVNDGSISVLDTHDTSADNRTLSTIKTNAATTRSNISSTTTSLAGVTGNFSNTGDIKSSLAANGFDALSVGTNVLGDDTLTLIKGSNVTSTMSSTSGVQSDFTNDVQSLRTGNATLIYKDVYNMDADGKVDPRYYDQGDAHAGERVKSNVVDRVVYDRGLAKGEISTSLAADAVMLDATGSNDIFANTIGTSSVDVVQVFDTNTSKVNDVQTIKVTSQDVNSTSTVRAGIGGKFTNKNIMKTSLAKNALTAMATGSATLGKTNKTEIDGGNVRATTNVYAGIGNGASPTHRGFLNAANTYDDGAVQTGTSKVIAGRNNSSHLYTDKDANSDLNTTDSNLSLALIDSEEVNFWNKTKVIGTMTTSLAKDVVKVDGTSSGSILAKTISSVSGDVNLTSDNEIISVQGHYVEGDAKATVTETTNTFAGIKGGFTNQGKMSASLAGHVLNAEGTASGVLGDVNTAITGSTATQTTTMTAGVQGGDFRNEVQSLNLDTGVVITKDMNGTETPEVVYDKTTTDGQVEMSTSLAKTAAYLESHAVNSLLAKDINASGAVVDSHSTGASRDTRTISTILSDAENAKSTVSSSASSTAGVSGDFYNTGKISASLAKEAFDAIADSTNTLGDSTVSITGSDVTATTTSTAGIRGDFLNDVVSLDDGAKTIIQKDVYDANGNPVYELSGDTHPGDRIKSNVVDRVVYGQKVVEGEISTSLAGDAVKLDATGTNNLTPTTIGTADVRVVRLTDSTTGIRSTADANLTVKVTSDTNATTNVTAGIGGSFTNKSSKQIKTSLSKNAITAIATATTNLGDAANTDITGGTTTATTTVKAGIGHEVENTHKGLYNLTNSYDNGAVQTATTQLKSANNSATVISADANSHVATDTNNSLPLIDSEEVTFWNKTVKVAKISTSLSKDTFNLEGTSTGNLTPQSISSATNDVNVSTDGNTSSIVALTGYHVTGSSSKANVTQTTTAYAGVNGEFKNQGEISTSLAGNVVMAKGTATGTLGDVAHTNITGSSATSNTYMYAGIDGDFTNEVQSLDTDGHVGTKLVGTTESSKLYFDKTTTDGQVKLKASLSKDVINVDAVTTNTVRPKTATAADAIIATDATDIADALSARSIVSGTSYTLSGINGDFNNTGIMEASLSKNVLTSNATSDNNLGTSAVVVQGSKVTANSTADSLLRGSFTNDAKLFDDGSATLLMKKEPVDGNDSNVIDTVTYSQKLVQGLMKSSTSKDVLSMVATGNNDMNLAEVGNKTVKVVTIGSDEKSSSDALSQHSAVDVNVSSDINATNVAQSGITGKFVNAGTIESSAGKIPLDFQAVGGTGVTIAKMTGGKVDASNTVISGINLKGNSSQVGFLNDKRDFNTVLKTDSAYDTNKVATGEIKTDGTQTVINMVADGGLSTDVTPDSAHIETTNDNNTYDTATVNNTGSNRVIINGDFVNKGTLSTGGAGIVLNMSATNSVSTDVHTITDKGLLSSTADATSASYIYGDINNYGTIQTGGAADAIKISSIGGTSAISGNISADENLTQWAGANGKVAAKSTSTTFAGAYDLNNTGTIQTGGAGVAINLSASGIADSSGFTPNTAVTTTANNAVMINHQVSEASLRSIYNIGTIQSGGAIEAIKADATGGAKTAVADSASDVVKSYEDTKATVTASLGNITNDAYTVQNKLFEVNKAFNTDGNASTDDQLKPSQATVTAYRGEYDFATGAKTDTNSSTYSTEAERNALAYDDNNSSKNPILTQSVGTITAGGAAAAIKLSSAVDSSNTDDESTVISATADTILNKGIIGTGSTTIGIDLSADGHTGTDAIAKTTTGQIYNAVTDNNFTNNAGDVLHAIIQGKIAGTTNAIKLTSKIDNAIISNVADENRSVVTVQRIENNRLVLHKGDVVVDGDITNALNNNAVTTQAQNYSTATLTRDTVYSAVMSGTDAIEVGLNAHVTEGIHNYGTITGNVKLGDADIYLYGLMDDNSTDSGNLNNLTLSQAQFDADTHTQVAGIVDGNINTSFAGSSITMEGAHIFKSSPTWEADEIKIAKNATANIASDTTFDTSAATDPFSKGLVGRFSNRGILNIAAGKKAIITGKYAQLENGSFISHLIGSGVIDGDNAYDATGAEFGILTVTGDASFNSNGITLVVDGNKTDSEWTALATSGTDTILKGIVVAGSVDGNTTANTTPGSVVNVTVTDNLTTVNFKAIQGDAPGTIDLILETASSGTPLLMGDIVQVHETIANDFSNLVSTRLDQTNGYGIDYSKMSENNQDTDKNYVSFGRRIKSGLHNFGQRIKSGFHNFGQNRKTNWLNFKQKVAKSLRNRTYWAKPFVSHSSQDTEGDVAGYNSNAYGVAIGTDREYLNGWRSGVAFAFAKSKVDSTSGPVHHDEANVFEFIGYTSKKLSKGVINLQLGYGLMKNDGSRIDETTADVLTSKFDSTVLQAKAEYERAFKSKRLRDTTFIPYVQAFAAHIKNDGYTEGGVTSSALKIDSSSQDTFTAGSGIKVRHDLLRYRGTIVGHAGFNYDLKNDPTRTSYTPLSGADGGYVTGAKRKRFEADLGLGFQYLTTHNNRILLDYEFKGRSGYKNHVGSIKFIVPIGK